jgi:hypothetical protein
MGGVLSGVLANIYLAYLEKQMIYSPFIHYYIFTRFVDDILIISPFNEDQFSIFVQTLSQTYNLQLTCKQNHHSINYLDMTIKFVNNHLITQPYSKNVLLYPVPSYIQQQDIYKQINIIKSQILRTYRISSNDTQFSASILFYLKSLSDHYTHNILKRVIFNYLKPIKIGKSIWTCSIPLCGTCQHISAEMNIQIKKIEKIKSNYLALKSPLNCQTKNIHLIHYSENEPMTIQLVSNLHQFIKEKATTNDITILPIGHLKLQTMQNILIKFPDLFHPCRNDILKRKLKPPCFIHPIVNNPMKIYGVSCANRRQRNIGHIFNTYKRVCQ